jgi:hypothetical protein
MLVLTKRLRGCSHGKGLISLSYANSGANASFFSVFHADRLSRNADELPKLRRRERVAS